jgi:hypothetical protein
MRALLAVGLVLATTLAAAKEPSRLREPKRGFQMRVSPFEIESGEDLEVCEYRRLPNKKAIDVTGFEVRMPPGAHHFVVWGYGGDLQDDAGFPAGPVESVGCIGISPDEIFPQILIPLQIPNVRYDFPKGVALRIEPRQQVWLNPHMKNFSRETISPDIRFNFYRARKKRVRYHAEALIVGNTFNIRIPPRGEQTLTAEWTAPADMTVFQLATHQHRLGTYANVQLVAPDGTPRKIYENTNWEHPWSYEPDPAIKLAKGDKMRITCTWHNTEDYEVRFGEETTDEMCFILGFFYREEGDTVPIVDQQCVPANRGLLCPLVPAVQG